MTTLEIEMIKEAVFDLSVSMELAMSYRGWMMAQKMALKDADDMAGEEESEWEEEEDMAMEDGDMEEMLAF